MLPSTRKRRCRWGKLTIKVRWRRRLLEEKGWRGMERDEEEMNEME
jgi:hypothetical protein